MLNASSFIEKGRGLGFDFYTGVPCSYLTSFINYVINNEELIYVAAANEGDAVAIAAGASLGEKKSVVMLQNSGLGNAVNPLTSLNYIFRIPILIIVTLRGEPGTSDEPQHELMGKITGRLLEEMKIPWEFFPESDDQIDAVWTLATRSMEKLNLPFALVMKKGLVNPVKILRGIGSKRRPEEDTVVNNRNGDKPFASRKDALSEIIKLTPV